MVDCQSIRQWRSRQDSKHKQHLCVLFVAQRSMHNVKRFGFVQTLGTP